MGILLGYTCRDRAARPKGRERRPRRLSGHDDPDSQDLRRGPGPGPGVRKDGRS